MYDSCFDVNQGDIDLSNSELICSLLTRTQIHPLCNIFFDRFYLNT